MTTTPVQLLRERAAGEGDRPFLRFAAGEHSFAEVDARSDAVAAGLAARGVGEGDVVALLMANRIEFVLTWFGALKLGAVAAPINTAFRGPGLEHAVATTGARVLVADEDAPATALEPTPFAALEAPGEPAPPAPSADPLDPAMILFTSGTTGRSKGCLLSHRYLTGHAELACRHFGLRADDVLYSPFPLFHVDAAVFTVMPALTLGATAAIGERFSARGFWPEVRRFGATVFDFMGATLTILAKAEPRPDDADNPVRLAWGVPVPPVYEEIERRFGLRLVEPYGLTDAGIVMYEPAGERHRPGSCGRPVAPFEVCLIGDDEPGEIAIRSHEPGLLMLGYHGDADATAEALRDGWLHTGDLATRDEDGFFSFVGRTKDVIRRRGENVSAFEVEEVVEEHPAVLEAAAFGVPSELTEEDVMVAVVARPGRSLDPDELIAYCEPRMARHMVPRYVDVRDALPRTPTEKVEKHRLGLTASTWDREA